MSSYAEQLDLASSAIHPPLLAVPSYLETLPPTVEALPTSYSDQHAPPSRQAASSIEQPPQPSVQQQTPTSAGTRPLPPPVEPPPSSARNRPPPPPPPPPSTPLHFQSAFSEAVHPDYDEEMRFWDAPYDWSGFLGNKTGNTGKPEISPADVAVVHTAADLSLELQFHTRDIEIKSHIDARSLNFTAAPLAPERQTDCETGSGKLERGCGYLQYMHFGRSIRGNCDGPPSEEEAKMFNLSESAISTLREVRRGQCVIFLDKSAIAVSGPNKWIDNLYFAYMSDTVVSDTVTAVSALHTNLLRGFGLNIFFSNVTFHAWDGFRAAQPFAIPQQNPYLMAPLQLYGGEKAITFNSRHSVHFEDCEFLGFEGDSPLLLITQDSYATLRNCLFRDVDLTVELFDLSFGGRLRLEECTFRNVLIRRQPPKLVATSMNDEIPCAVPNEDAYKYHSDDDYEYDIVEEGILEPSDTGVDFVVSMATMSDCLRALHKCEYALNHTGPWPGCPSKSVTKRRRINHNSCGCSIGPDDPDYYDYGSYVSLSLAYSDEGNYFSAFASEHDPELAAKLATVKEVSPFCYDYELYYDLADPDSVTRQAMYVQYGFLTTDSPWFQAVKQILPQHSRNGSETWSWPKVPQTLPSGTSATAESSGKMSEGSGTIPGCSSYCVAAVSALVTATVCGCFVLALVMWQRRRSKEAKSPLEQQKSLSVHDSCMELPQNHDSFQTCVSEDIREENSDDELQEDLSRIESSGERKRYTSICSSGGLDAQNAAEQSGSSHASRSALGQGGEARESQSIISGRHVSHRQESWYNRRSFTLQPAASKHMSPQNMNVFRVQSTEVQKRIKEISAQLDTFQQDDLLLGRYQMLGVAERRSGGQAVVQFVKRQSDNREFAVKFFLRDSAFHTERSLYAAFTSKFRGTEIGTQHQEATVMGSTHGKYPEEYPSSSLSGGSTSWNSFLPRIESMHPRPDAQQGRNDRRLQDASGAHLPPCIVMERGDSLQDWVGRSEPDKFAAFWVLANIVTRMQCMHEAGYVHMDVKPANIVLMPRDNKWAVIDFGCAAKIGTHAPLAFTATYCPPEVLKAAEGTTKTIIAATAIDVWAVGVIAFELLTGAPAFRVITDGMGKVVAALKGDELLPWEGTQNEGVRTQLGSLRNVVLQMLHRDPACRPDMQYLYQSIQRLHVL